MKDKKKIGLISVFGGVFVLFVLIACLCTAEFNAVFYLGIGFVILPLLFLLFSLPLADPCRTAQLHFFYISVNIYQMAVVVPNLFFIGFGLQRVWISILVNVLIAIFYSTRMVIRLMLVISHKETVRQAVLHNQTVNAHYDLCDAVCTLRGRGKSLRLNKRIEAFCDAVTYAQMRADVYGIGEYNEKIVAAATEIDEMLSTNAEEEQILSRVESAISIVQARDDYIKNHLMRGV